MIQFTLTYLLQGKSALKKWHIIRAVTIYIYIHICITKVNTFCCFYLLRN